MHMRRMKDCMARRKRYHDDTSNKPVTPRCNPRSIEALAVDAHVEYVQGGNVNLVFTYTTVMFPCIVSSLI